MLSFLIGIFTIFLLSPGVCRAQIRLTSEEFYQGIQDGIFTAVVDVRTLSEWEDGHIENATLVENLASTGSMDPLLGCESCTLGIYCRSGARAGQAITRLIDAGFQGTLYNGLGTSGWVAAGYPLVTGDSIPAVCAGETDFCAESESTPAPTMAPTLPMTGSPSSSPSASPSSNPTMSPSQSTSSPPTSALLPQPTNLPTKRPDVVQLTSEEFYQGIQDGIFTAVVDVRTLSEWEDGHIENATLVENLASTGSIDPLLGCESCDLGIYCRSGARAGQAISRLKAAGFQGTLYNGLGTRGWVAAGYPLVTGDSMDAACTEQVDYCGEGAADDDGSNNNDDSGDTACRLTRSRPMFLLATLSLLAVI